MKKTFRCINLIIILVILASCSNETEEFEKPLPTLLSSPETYIEGEQEFEIYTYYQSFLDFLAQAEKQPDNVEEIYKNTVLNSFKENGFSYSDFNAEIFYTPSDVVKLRNTIEVLIERQDELNTTIKQALATSVAELPGGSKKIHIMPIIPEITHNIEEEAGSVGGYAWNKNNIVLLVGPSFLEVDLAYTVAHEYHHVVYMDTKGGKWYTLLEQAVLEGKADTFATMLYPESFMSYYEPFTTEENTKVMAIFSANLESTDVELSVDFLYGDEREDIPQFATYIIGSQIMEALLTKHSNLTVEEWTKMPAKEVLEKSNLLLNKTE